MARHRGTIVDLTDRASNLLLQGLIGLALALPFRLRVPMMGWVMARILGPLVGYRRRAISNLAFIYPDLTPLARFRLATAALNNAGRTIIENYSGAAFGRHLADAPVTGPGLLHLTGAATSGRPVIFVTGHFGNYEAPRHVLLARGYQIGGLYRPMSNPYFNRHYVRTMEQVSGPIFDKGRRGTLAFARFLKGGGMGTILFDIHVPTGPSLPFLGQPALTATSAAEFALRFDALLIPYFGIRQADGRTFTVELCAPIPHSDPVTMTALMTADLERQIAAYPGQWFWVHDRWRRGY